MGYFYDYGLLILGLIITSLATLFINSSYSKYKKVKSKASIRGVDIANYILNKHGLNYVKVTETSGNLTDHYDPRVKQVRLSSDIYNGTSIASLAVAAHECGHAIQDQEGYLMMKLRSALVPIVNIASYAGYIAILIGLGAKAMNIIWIGIYCELAILLFEIVTLPVEINASRRGIKELKEHSMIEKDEYHGSKVMLVAAASTYLAAALTSLIQVVRLLLLVRERK